MLSTRATSRRNHRSSVRACDSLCGTFCSCNFPESQVNLAHLPYVLVRKPQFGVYPFQRKVKLHCIHCVYGHSGVDSKEKLHTFFVLRVMFTLNIYPNMISYQVAAAHITWARKGHNLFFKLLQVLFVNFTFFISFFLNSKTPEEGKRRKGLR